MWMYLFYTNCCACILIKYNFYSHTNDNKHYNEFLSFCVHMLLLCVYVYMVTKVLYKLGVRKKADWGEQLL